MKNWCLYVYFSSICFVYVEAQQKNNFPSINYTITNDYLSERNYTIEPMPYSYSKPMIDSLKYCKVEFFRDSNIVKENQYSAIGTLYFTYLHSYDKRHRKIKTIQINEYQNDSSTVYYKYKDSLDFTLEKHTIEIGSDTNRVDVIFKWNAKGQKVGLQIFENSQLYINDTIAYPSHVRKEIKSYNAKHERSDYIYLFNEQDDIFFEKKSWSYIEYGKKEIISEAFEYTYKYDVYGNWIEKKKVYSNPERHAAILNSEAKTKQLKGKQSNSKTVLAKSIDFPEIKEHLFRTIYYEVK
jgi:hypothetical protein